MMASSRWRKGILWNPTLKDIKNNPQQNRDIRELSQTHKGIYTKE